MSHPYTNVTNSADDSATVGAQAQVIHGDVTTYFIRPGATAKEKYEVGVNYLNGGVPSTALSWIERAIAEGHGDTSEVRFHWLLALLSGRTSRQLPAEVISRLDALKKHPVLCQSNPWADGIRAVLGLVDSVRSAGADPASAIDALEQLHPAQRELVLRHITVLLRGPRGEQMWRLDIEAAETGRCAKGRDKLAAYFFYPAPAEPLPRQSAPAAIPPMDWVKAVAASVFFVLALLTIGAVLVSRVSIIGIIGYLVGCSGVGLAASGWVESRWQAWRHAEHQRRIAFPARAPEAGFATRVDQRFDWYLHIYAPDKENVPAWLQATAGLRSELRDEIAEIYRGRRVKVERLNWLFGHEVRQLVDRRKRGTLHALPDDESLVRLLPLWAGIIATVLGILLLLPALLSADPGGGFIALIVLGVAGYEGTRRWTSIALEHRRATADAAECARKFSERQSAYDKWHQELITLRPRDPQMAEWLECDKKAILARALRHYGLNRTDVISYAFLETPGTPYDRASVRNGPWRYTHYKMILFLLTADGIRQVSYDLNTRNGEIQQRDWRSYRYDAIASVEASVAKNGDRQEFKLHLMNAQVLPFRAAEPITDWNPEESNAEALSLATEEATGLRNTLRILEGVAADGKGWIARESQ